MERTEAVEEACRKLEEAATLLDRAGVDEYVTAVDELVYELVMDVLAGERNAG